ncbi:MAG TPA: molybdopterin-dependent oxidoreductase [Solirubrobacteraceae bacterium]|nr:molybdopterin-dependent oxidoreductase [Solirubrobacteraceae bacterium]
MTERVRTLCPYCGVGCGLIAEVENGRLTAVAGDPEHPVNRGATCRKPLGLPDAVHAPDRALHPLWRESTDARFERLSWRGVMGRLARRLRAISAEHGPDAIAVYISGQLLTEDYYAAAKLVKGFLGTNNLDSNSRLCMSSAVAGYTGAFGSDGPPAAYSDIDRSDCLLLVGSNTAACHPIVWARIAARRRAGAKVIVIDPRRTPTAEGADLHLPIRPGTDLPLLSAMLGVLADEGLVDELFVARHTTGFAEALAAAREWTPQRAAEVCGVAAHDIIAAARMFGEAPRAMALWSMGVNQSRVGTLKNRAVINLCLATGNVGRPGSGPLSLTGQPNAMGGRETGGLSTLLPGYRSVANPEHRAEMRRLWDLPADHPGISPTPGLAATELLDGLESGQIKAVWVVATNPAVSQPDARRFSAALGRAELLICQDAYHPTETSARAHVILPAAQWPEKAGTMTNSERRVGLVAPALSPPGEARPDWEIFARLGRAMGHAGAFAWRTAAEVYDEYVRATAGRPCDVSGLSHARLGSGSPQWPVPAGAARAPVAPGAAWAGEDGVDAAPRMGTERLYTSLRFPTPTGQARFAPTPHAEPADTPDGDFPLVLVTGRLANQWHTMTRTAKSPDLMAAEPEPFVELHPHDAAAAQVADGDRVRLRSRQGQAILRARVSEAVAPGVAFAPFHWGALHLRPGHGAVGQVVHRALDPQSKQAELKATAVCVEPVPAGPAAPSARPAGRAGSGGHVATSGRRRLVIVGGGMAAMATVESVLEHGAGQAYEITLLSREPELPYNRILLSKLLAGTAQEAELTLRDPDWLARHGVVLRSGCEVTALDLARRRVELSDGEELAWDRLVLATGSRALLPALAGVELPGVHAFRSLADARGILAAAAGARRAVVIGGGLLGLEAARGLRSRGLQVSVVHLAGRLMERQLDAAGATLLQRAIEALGVEVLLDAQAEAITGTDTVAGVRLSDGRERGAELVVIAAGVAPEVDLARTAGLEVGRGIVVDDELRTSSPGVYAVGECSQHRGVVYGLWAPLLEQAKVAGASLARAPAAFRGAVPATTLKVAGIDLFCGGRADAEAGDEEVVALDTRRGRYRRLLLREDRLVGTILLGDLRDARTLREHLGGAARLPETLLEPMPAGIEATPVCEQDPAGAVCTCMAVSRGEIVAAITAFGLDSVRTVGEHTRAGTGCGTCRRDIQRLLDAVRDGEASAPAGRASAPAGRASLPTPSR